MKINGREDKNGKLPHDVYFSSNIIWVIKSRIMNWAGHETRFWTGEVHTGFWWGNLRERGHLEYPGIDAMIILTHSLPAI